MDNLALALLLGGDGGGGYRDDIFHNILETSEKIADIIINEQYRFTYNLWVCGYPQCGLAYLGRNCADTESKADGIGYDNGFAGSNDILFKVRILWKGDNPLYATLEERIAELQYYPMSVAVNGNLTDNDSYTFYSYYSQKQEYIKGSAVYAGEFNAVPQFRTWDNLTGVMNIDFSDGTIEGASSAYGGYSIHGKYYTTIQEKLTDIPTVVLESETTIDRTVSVGGYIRLIPFSRYNDLGCYSDLTRNELLATEHEVKKALIEKYDNEHCYTHKAPVWLKQ